MCTPGLYYAPARLASYPIACYGERVTTSGALVCPVCRTPLTELAADGTSIFLPVCSQCGGTWLDIPRSQRVVRGLISETEKALAAHAAKAAASAGTASYRDAASRETDLRLCADCSAPLKAVLVKEIGVTLDACSAHGTWFDAEELAAVAQSFALKAAADDADVEQFETAGTGVSIARLITGFLR